MKSVEELGKNGWVKKGYINGWEILGCIYGVGKYGYIEKMGKKWVELVWINGVSNGWVKKFGGQKRGKEDFYEGVKFIQRIPN
jgi:hypothetical protein